MLKIWSNWQQPIAVKVPATPSSTQHQRVTATTRASVYSRLKRVPMAVAIRERYDVTIERGEVTRGSRHR